ncbi:MAG: Nuclear control of ATPase protein 2 [Thelocarpon impressellum]|nr:MAG: Nuclear control of ATPase protein 2 [Thelocarpon impressellum]
MSFVEDQVRRIDAQLDRLVFKSAAIRHTRLPDAAAVDESPDTQAEPQPDLTVSRKLVQLQAAIKALSTKSSSRTLLPATRIASLLERSGLLPTEAAGVDERIEAPAGYDDQLQWLLVGKATTQTYGLILNTLLEQTIPLTNDIWYWDDVLSSYGYTVFYSVQTSPLRLWDWSKDVYHDAKRRLDFVQVSGTISETSDHAADASSSTTTSFRANWGHFYRLVRASIRERSISDIQRRVVSPFAVSRAEARKKQRGLKKLREMNASGLGVLMDEGLTLGSDEEVAHPTRRRGSEDVQANEEWKSVVEKSVALIETVLRNVTELDVAVPEFEDTVFASVEDDPELLTQSSNSDSSLRAPRPALLAKRLHHILKMHYPEQATLFRALTKRYGRPNFLIRYWLPASILLVSSSAILRILVKRKAAVMTWIRELGTTVLDFWTNWVVEPTRKVISTIRHDEEGEVAIMSKRSLEGDRESLERMVVDFATDNPTTQSGAPLTDSQIADIRAKVREGDLTPVLKAYEKDLRRPFMGTVRGDLIRALLIQLQKTKVDVEVAVGGIDALLKSQELVFGFVGLTPGMLVCLGLSHWLSGVLGNRKGYSKIKQQGQMIRVLRNTHRILTASTSSNNGMLSYKEHGLLLCEVHVLRRLARNILPSEIHREFLEEIGDLVDIRTGVERQLKVVERMRWAYDKWMR